MSMSNISSKNDSRGVIAWLKSTKRFPNFLTGIRILLFWVPAAFIVSDLPPVARVLGALLSFVLIVATDFLDGHFARAWDQVSNFGKLWDPLADKLLVGTVLLALCWVNALQTPWAWAFTVVTIGREVTVSVLRLVKSRSGSKLIIPANWDGKLKMNFQAAGLVFAIVAMAWPVCLYVAWPAFIGSLWFSVKSGWAYVKA